MFILEMGRYVAEAFRQQGRYLQENLGHLGLSPRSLSFFIVLAQEGPLTPSEMSEKLNSDKTRTAKALRALQGHSYIETTPDEADRRVKKIRLSDKGRRVFPEIRRVMDRMDGAVDEKFDREDMLRTGEILEAYSNTLKGLIDNEE